MDLLSRDMFAMPDGKKVTVLQMKQYLEELEATEPKGSDTRRFLPTMKNTVQLLYLFCESFLQV